MMMYMYANGHTPPLPRKRRSGRKTGDVVIPNYSDAGPLEIIDDDGAISVCRHIATGFRCVEFSEMLESDEFMTAVISKRGRIRGILRMCGLYYRKVGVLLFGWV